MESAKTANLQQIKIQTPTPPLGLLLSLRRLIPLLVAGVGAILAFWNYSGSPTGTSNAETACRKLSQELPNSTHYPTSALFQHDLTTYWSVFQSNTISTCRITPQSAKEVSVILKIIRLHNARFAVKSGGHAPFNGASNIADGVTIDLQRLNHFDIVGVNDHKEPLIMFGPGLRWKEVYGKLESQGLTMLGGRAGSVGVGGLILGGGISYFSGRHGFVADGIVNFEVVLANGTIVNANKHENSDLWWSLKGGGNNFGIVTSFTTRAFKQNLMWAGWRIYVGGYVNMEDVYTSYVKIANSQTTEDPDQHLIMSFGSIQYIGHVLGINYNYAKPVMEPKVYVDSGLGGLTDPIYDTQGIRNLSSITEELEGFQPNGYRQKMSTATFKTSTSAISHLIEIWYSELDPIFPTITNFTAMLNLQPLSVKMLQHSKQSGGNPFPFNVNSPDDQDGPLTLMNIIMSWSDPKDDDSVNNVVNRVLERQVEYARSTDMYYPWIYQNYASEEQDVFGSYGRESSEKLRKVAKEVDPDHLFQKLQPGYFKLF